MRRTGAWVHVVPLVTCLVAFGLGARPLRAQEPTGAFRSAYVVEVKDGAGEPLPVHLSHMQTWSVDTRGANRVVAEFDYLANVMALNQAKLTDSFAFFTGTQLFLEPVGHRGSRAARRATRRSSGVAKLGGMIWV